MSDCQVYRDLIDRYLDGTLSDTGLAELKAHTHDCQTCRDEFDRAVLLMEAIEQSFSADTPAEQARASVLAKLSRWSQPQVGRVWTIWARTAVAAGVLLGVGLLSGFVLGRANPVTPAPSPPLTRVPIQIGELEGTVLVRHQGRDVWRLLEVGSNVYLGDTFHSAAKSGFLLQLDDKSRIGVGQNSMLALTLYNGETQFFLEHGECTASLESHHGPFFICTPHGRVEALGTEFTVTVE
jgi:ferric-dicitrate binding protein FerR (iron transport regulator)